MAVRGWGGSIATAIGVAAGAGAAQLGLGYGLGIINWAPTDATAGEATWIASLTWAAWIAATSTVAGAVFAQRLHDRGAVEALPSKGRDGLRQFVLALAAATGALLTVVLVAVPARTATPADTFAPQTVAAGYTGIGAIVGLLIAIWALHSRAAASNVIATVGWLWLLAVIAVVDGVLSGRGLTTAQLGVWQITAENDRFWFRDYFYWPGAALSLGSALVIGALAARRTARRPHTRVGAAASGAAGPLLIATAYFLAVPRLETIRAEQVSAHLIAPYAVIAGLGGSILMAALAQRADTATTRAVPPESMRVSRQRTGSGPGDPVSTDGSTPIKPTPIGEATADRPTTSVTRPEPTAVETEQPVPAGAKPAQSRANKASVPVSPAADRPKTIGPEATGLPIAEPTTESTPPARSKTRPSRKSR